MFRAFVWVYVFRETAKTNPTPNFVLTMKISRLTYERYPSITSCKVNVKVKLSLCFFLTEHHAMKAYWGSRGIQLNAFFNLGTGWRWVVSFTPRPIYSQGKSSWYPLDRRLGGPQSCSGRGGEEKNFQPHRESNPAAYTRVNPKVSGLSR
jgi:hypothetical protein